MRKGILLLVNLVMGACLFSQDIPGPGDYVSLSEDGAWCWFSDPRSVSYKGIRDRTYTGWVSSEGDIVISAYDNLAGKIERDTIRHKFQRDDHDNPSILFRPGGKILLFYSHHGGSMYVVSSVNPEDISSWEPESEISILGTNVCYSNPVQLSSENNRIYLFFRGSDWQPGFSYSDDGGKTWSGSKVLINTQSDNNSRRPYLKIASDGISRIDIAFTDGHPRNEDKNSVYHVSYREGKFYQANGQLVCGISELPLLHEQVNKVYDGTATGVRAWIWDIALDDNNLPVIAYTRLPEEKDHRYHYARWDGKKWADTELAEGGGWFPQTPVNSVEREPHYSGGIAIDHNRPEIVYLSRPVNGNFEIEKYITPDKGLTWTHKQVTGNSGSGNVRPFVVRNYSENGPQLLWENISGYYIHYTNFQTSIKCDLPAETPGH